MQPISQQTNERVYSLDALRGIMMLLGIVIHTGITYGTLNYQAVWPLKDGKSTSLLFDIFVAYIHAFRMPVFMVAAGYFGALLFYKKGGNGMLRNRVNRILFPFIAGVLIIYPLIAFAFTYSNAAFSGATNAMQQAVSIITSGSFLPFKTVHLWFIYYLFLFSFAAFLIATMLKKQTRFTSTANELFKKITLNFWLRTIVSSILVFLCIYWMGTPFLTTSFEFIIDPPIFVTYFLFYGMGWMIYKSDCLKNLNKNPWSQLGIATLLFLISMLVPWPKETWTLIAQQAIAAVYISLFVFGFISLFLVYFHSFSPRLSYIMEASYWVYIIHLPIACFIPGLLASFALPAIVKFIIVFSLTTLISFVSYHYLVRGSFIGKFLNGKVFRQKKSFSELVAVE